MSVTLASVYARQGEDIQSLLKRFKRKVEASGHIPELKDRRYYKKPSTIKREQRNKIQYGLELEKKGILYPIKPKKLLKSKD